MKITKKTNIKYHGQSVEIVKDLRPNPFSKEFIPGYSFRVFDGTESYIISKSAFNAPEEAEASAKKAVEGWLAEEAKRQKEADAHKRFLQKTFATKEAAEAAGATLPAEYSCHECGATFWAEWRSGYSANPVCGTCGESAMVHKI